MSQFKEAWIQFKTGAYFKYEDEKEMMDTLKLRNDIVSIQITELMTKEEFERNYKWLNNL